MTVTGTFVLARSPHEMPALRPISRGKLGRIGGKKALDGLLEALAQDKAGDVRGTTASALGSSGKVIRSNFAPKPAPSEVEGFILGVYSLLVRPSLSRGPGAGGRWPLSRGRSLRQRCLLEVIRPHADCTSAG